VLFCKSIVQTNIYYKVNYLKYNTTISIVEIVYYIKSKLEEDAIILIYINFTSTIDKLIDALSYNRFYR
jgi:hypothetical protein